MRFLLLVLLVSILFGCERDNEECREVAKDACPVTNDINPVCGCNGITYSNPSSARCKSIEDYTIGACE